MKSLIKEVLDGGQACWEVRTSTLGITLIKKYKMKNPTHVDETLHTVEGT